MGNLVDGIQEQQKRVREVIIPLYEEIGPAGMLGLMFLRQSLERSERALASNDVVEMARAYKDLEGCD